MSKPIWLREEFVLIAHEVSLANHGGGEGIRDLAMLESALFRPQNKFSYGATDIPELAAAYSYGILRNHPFVDGNKRTGFLAGATFLELNGYKLVATEADATQTILAVAAGEMDEDSLAEWYRAVTVSEP